MAVQFTAGNNAVSCFASDLIKSALQEIGVLAAGEPLDANNAAWSLEKMQRIIDSLNAQREVIYSVNFTKFNLTANHAPHTIGPTGDFNVPIRPTRIISCAFVLNGASSNPVDLPVKLRDGAWWAANPLKSLTGSVITDLYYEPSGPLGNLNFFPISNAVAPVRLQSWNSLPQAIDLSTTSMGFVQGYWDAIVKTLAIELCPSFDKQPSGILMSLQQKAMRVIEGNNQAPPLISTDSGMPNSGKGGRPDFNFLTGTRE